MSQKTEIETEEKTRWLAIFSLFLGVVGLVGAEFLPISLLTPMAADLAISEGTAGQSVTIVGLLAVAASLLALPLAKNYNRRFIVLIFSALLVLSNMLAALAPNFAWLLLGRAILGLCVGGFWSLVTATLLRLAAFHHVSRALSLVFAGVSVATILAVPLASYAGHYIGWRGVFMAFALFGLGSFACQYYSLPSLPAGRAEAAARRGLAGYWPLLQTGWVCLGLAAIMGCYGGYYILFTYLRPFFEHSLHIRGSGLSLLLLGFSLANCAGTFIAGLSLARFFRPAMLLAHMALALVPLALLSGMSRGHMLVDAGLAMLWAGLFGVICVGWSAWIIRTMPEQAEPAGGLMVAAIQLAVMAGAALGGLILDYSGFSALLSASCAVLSLAFIALYGSFHRYYTASGRPV